jgi:phage nucleotide-binding protein
VLFANNIIEKGNKMEFEIKSTKDVVKTDGVKILMYGESGVGKTTALGTVEGKTLLLNVENGTMVLRDKDIDVIDIPDIATLGNVYNALSKGELKYDNVAIDSLSEIGEMVISELEADEYYGNPSNVFKLFGEYTRKMVKIAKMFRDLKGMNIILTALAENVEANGITTKLPMIPAKKAQAKLISLFDEVYYVQTKGDGERWVHTADGVGYRAKSRAGIFEREVEITDGTKATLGTMIKKIKTNK